MDSCSKRSQLFFSGVKKDFSLSAMMAGIIAVTVSYAGPLLIVFQAARLAGLSEAQLSSWIWAISFSSGAIGLLLSAWFRVPVIAAWSTPGAVLLVSGWSSYTYPEAVGAFVAAGIMATVLGGSGLFAALMERVPEQVIAAMLAGILLKFGVDVFVAVPQMPLVTLPMIVCYLACKRWVPRCAVGAAFLVGIAIAGVTENVNTAGINLTLVQPLFTVPSFSLQSIMGLGIPLFVIAMAAQNATGMGVLKVDGYDISATPIVTATGLASFVFAPFGSHGVNLAAITAAICTGREAHIEKSKRYIAGMVCGGFYILVSLFGGTISSVFAALPLAVVAVIAGIALFSSITTSLAAAMRDETGRESALVAFLVTVSGISLWGVGAPFWGLLAGMATEYILIGPRSGSEELNVPSADLET